MKLKSILSSLLFILWGVANAQVEVPEKIIGNWIDEKTNNWEYGFFEKFAVYKSDFWEYQDIQINKNRVEIKLKKGTQTESLKLKLSGKTNAPLTIARNQEKAGKYKLNQAGFANYPKPDDKNFKNSGFKPDTVTIIGYYRNFAQFKKNIKDERQKGPFKISVPNFILDKSIEYFADIDSLGQFKIKFPVLNTQQVYLDWGRVMLMDVVEPGEEIFLFADMTDCIDMGGVNDRASWEAFKNKPKQILYMGQEARIHNELAHYNGSNSYFDRGETAKKVNSDLDYLVAAQLSYENKLRHLEGFIKSKPTISQRFKEYQMAYEKYQLAFHLMQHRFDKLGQDDRAFDKGYMEFVNSTMDFDDEKVFTLIREYSTFIRDYVDYHNDLKNLYKDEKTGQIRSKGISVSDIDVLRNMFGKGILSKPEEAVVLKFSEIEAIVFPRLKALKDTTGVAEIMRPYKKTFKDYMAIVERPEMKESLPELRSQLFQKLKMEADFKHIDSLIQNKTLKQLLVARALTHSLDHDRVPLTATALHKLDEQITVQPIKDYVSNINNHYVKLGNQKVSYLASLKNTEHLKEAKDPDKLFKELVAPYKGKVIYIDFWGTWCGPCKEQMPFIGAVKKELAGKEVVFMYLANNSPEKSWLNVIKEMNLTGENVVHYRLPAEQQAMIERKFSVNSFPTYLIIGKDGNLVKDDAPRPEMQSELVSVLTNLLKD